MCVVSKCVTFETHNFLSLSKLMLFETQLNFRVLKLKILFAKHQL